jgi:homocysteine S-methyltransferase
MYKKIENGANYFLTQPIYEENVIEELKKLNKDKNVKILGGVMPLVSYRNAQFLNNEIPGINIPDRYVNRFKKDMDKEIAQEIGIEIAVELAKKMKDYVDGFYFMAPFNRANMIKKIMKKLEL